MSHTVSMNFLNGQILAFDKPYGVTSFQVVARVRRLLTQHMGGRKLRVGHAGTLDPLATGVLIVCTGRATKKVEQLQAHTKEYVAELRLGETTPSFDQEHPVDHTYPTAHLTETLVRETLTRFVGEIMQVPPVYSAVKVAGDRAYELARKGCDVTLKAKPLRIDEIELQELRLPHYARLRVVCGKGTYIRALARDIGEALGCGAHLTSLRRTRVGDVTTARTWQPDDFERWLDRQELDCTPPDGPIPSDFPFIEPENRPV